MGTRGLAIGVSLAVSLVAGRALAGAAAQDGEPLPADSRIDFAPEPPEGNVHDVASIDRLAPPPPRPRPHGVVVMSSLGVLGFAGRFRRVAPPAPWLHGQIGLEIFPWLMLYGAGELAFTDTGVSQDPTHLRAFNLWGVDGGARVTVRANDRVAIAAEIEAGALTATVPHDALALLGYRGAESLGATAGGRLTAEWYQANRHLALFAAGGGRYASGFATKLPGASDLPLMWDGGVGIRYTF